tara:strand:- start:2 stop:667 length:666 start_codon:yes stop_codon:yes gene_type:complete
MDEITSSANNPKKEDMDIEASELENKQNPEKIDVSIFDETLKEIDQILNKLENKTNADQNQQEQLDILPEIKNAVSKIKIAKDELTKEENNLIKDNNLIKRIEDLEKNNNNSNKSILLFDDLKKDSDNNTQEHQIDRNLLSTEELHHLRVNNVKEKKNFFGFYSYVLLIIVVTLALYGVLSVTKDLIISEYPITEIYINYFYEIIEIIKITILNFSWLGKN